MSVGPEGRVFAADLRRARGSVTVRELSAKLRSLGRPILPSGITKIEQGARRVDIDDLFALARALDETPESLLGRPIYLWEGFAP